VGQEPAVSGGLKLAPEIQLEYEPFGYQLAGIHWLYGMTGALLADQPGLGKTAQSILAARLLRRDGKIKQTLVICPKTIIGNWCDEYRRWDPQGKILICRSDKLGFLRSAFPVKIMNYEALNRIPIEDLERLPPHDLIICDEVMRGKNPHTRTARAIKAIPATRRWALTGTPVENRIGDLASIMGFCVPGDVYHDVNILRSVPDHPWFVRQRQRIFAPLCHSIAVADDPAEAGRLAAPYVLRRRREDVLPDLPDKFEQDVELQLVGRQRDAYDRAEQEGVVQLNELGDELTISHIFQLIGKLRQICNFDPVSGASCKLDRLLSDLEEIRASGHKTLVFSQFVEECGLRRIARYLPSPLQIHGGICTEDRMAAARRFNTHATPTEMLLNYMCGGTGLNLYGASYVFLFDRWWNPAVEDQAVGRAYRIGQKNKVIVRKFVCRDTIEERILVKLAEKRRVFQEAIDDPSATAASSCGLSRDEIFDLFRIKMRPRPTRRIVVPITPAAHVVESQTTKQRWAD